MTRNAGPRSDSPSPKRRPKGAYGQVGDQVLIQKIRKCLTPDLLSDKFWIERNKINPMAGFCYIASEAYYHLSGEAVKPCYVEINLGTRKHPQWTNHWFLETPMGCIIDITADQFSQEPPYSCRRRCGFLTKQPSKRAQELIRRIRNA